jgi:hypothetical protein
MRQRVCPFVLVTGALFATGCGQSNLARVKGRVTCNGQPVPNAVLMFSPVAKSASDKESGKAAEGATDADGRYVASTYKSGDGALIGKHRVSVVLDNEGHHSCKGRVVEREIKGGVDNEVDIELNEPGTRGDGR